MVTIPKEVMDLLAENGSVKSMATVDSSGQPHVITAGTIGALDDKTMMIGQVLTQKSYNNAENNKKVAFIVTNGLKSYSIDAVLRETVSSGPLLEGVNQKLAAMHLVAKSILLFDVKAVYEQGANMNAGKQIA
jgi:predicted pyridoxine 5'-phosphate oxidase superfamily flavin-nucleotide-binding protein